MGRGAIGDARIGQATAYGVELKVMAQKSAEQRFDIPRLPRRAANGARLARRLGELPAGKNGEGVGGGGMGVSGARRAGMRVYCVHDPATHRLEEAAALSDGLIYDFAEMMED